MKYYCFSNYESPIYYHIANQLLEHNFRKTKDLNSASITDINLELNQTAALDLEYKDNLNNLCKKNKFDFYPKSYNLDDQNYLQVLSKITLENYYINSEYKKNIQDLFWILKPAMLNNGKNIVLFKNIEQVKQYYQSSNISKRLGGRHVLQRYIHDPKLINNRKFTFRVPVIATNFAGVFIYNNGYVNISANEYYPFDDFKNRKTHITNFVLDGKLAHIEQKLASDLEDFDQIFLQMQNIVKQIFIGLSKKYPDYLKPYYPNNKQAIEIFGFDFMLDNNNKLWLLEINQRPDSPVEPDYPLYESLWLPFWQAVIQNWVLYMAGVNPVTKIDGFTEVLASKRFYGLYGNIWRKFIKK